MLKSECTEDASEVWDLMAAFELCNSLHGPADPQTLATANRLARAFCKTGEFHQAVSLLDQLITQITACFGADHPMRVAVLGEIGEILFEQGHHGMAEAIQREVLEWNVGHFGGRHPSSLEAMGDLAVVLFKLGQDEEAGLLEQEAFEAARTDLGSAHAVTCVLAWNRMLTLERCNEWDAAREIVVRDLVWLLGKEPVDLGKVRNTIRDLISRRLNWGCAIPC